MSVERKEPSGINFLKIAAYLLLFNVAYLLISPHFGDLDTAWDDFMASIKQQAEDSRKAKEQLRLQDKSTEVWGEQRPTLEALDNLQTGTPLLDRLAELKRDHPNSFDPVARDLRKQGKSMYEVSSARYAFNTNTDPYMARGTGDYEACILVNPINDRSYQCLYWAGADDLSEYYRKPYPMMKTKRFSNLLYVTYLK